MTLEYGFIAVRRLSRESNLDNDGMPDRYFSARQWLLTETDNGERIRTESTASVFRRDLILPTNLIWQMYLKARTFCDCGKVSFVKKRSSFKEQWPNRWLMDWDQNKEIPERPSGKFVARARIGESDQTFGTRWFVVQRNLEMVNGDLQSQFHQQH